ncbi:MAG: diguanylate cyclase [Bacteroidetes bacterium]|nr:diguanylate cyclase [Bacteroidota bacterium]
MLTQLSIPRKPQGELSLDHRQLYAMGLNHARELSSLIWTDYNVHDPGITILELLSYAITDLGYRASFPVKDLLATKENNPDNMASQFFTARKILPNIALTEADYRKILIDIEGVRNAWIRKHNLSYFADTIIGELRPDDPGLPGIEEVSISGLYDLLIDFENPQASPEEKDTILNKAKALLQANRNLCEDFVNFDEVGTQVFELCADIELNPDADTSAVKAEIFSRVQNYLCPPVAFYSLSEMLQKQKKSGGNYSSDEIFEGPVLAHGFIDNDELDNAGLRSSIRLSDIISEIMDIKGVRAVKDIILMPSATDPDNPPSPPENKWLVPVDAGKKPVLNLDFLDDQYHFLKFYKRNMPVFPNLSDVAKALSGLKTRSKSDLLTEANDLPIPLGKYRNTGSYYSFQQHFPAIYGLSDAGLDSSADEKRKALAYQLKAYLLFYDQLMADYFAQLKNVKQLFSTDPDVHRTYFYQVVDSFTDYKRIYKDGVDVTTFENDIEPGIVHSNRRNRFLDHLIARFAERFNDFASIVHQSLGASPETIAAVKCDFLKIYDQLSSRRSLAYNYSLSNDEDLWSSSNISGLELRIEKLCGIQNNLRRNLSDFNFTIYSELDSTPGDEFRFRVRHKENGKIILSSSTHYATEADAQNEMRRAFRLGMLPSGYERKKTIDNRFYFNVVDSAGEVIARRIEYFVSEEKMNAAIDDLILYLNQHFSDEGMYLVENILLRPEPAETTDPFLPICKAEQQVSCSDFDPYSYRVHFILPAENGRFRNMQFRQFVEEVIREETPAHILPKVCWISREDMALLETAYSDWLYLKSGRDTTDRQKKLNDFIKALYGVKNIYPSNVLRDCNTNDDKFILGMTSLGSVETGKS